MSSPPIRHVVDREAILSLWPTHTRAQIIDKVRRPTGQKYEYGLIGKVVDAARKDGDPRAVYKRKIDPRKLFPWLR